MIDRFINLCGRHKFVVLLLLTTSVAAGCYSLRKIPVDALPDLGDTQVIVYSQWDRSPEMVEDQVTYPIVSALSGAPRVKTVRGISDYGSSFVYVIYEDGVDLYWARSRTLEYLSSALSHLPAGVKTELGPDASGVGWAFQYVVVDDSGSHSLAELRKLQDWFLRFQLKSIPGVSEIASVGGFEQQYQVQVDPNRLRAFGIGIQGVVAAIRYGNTEASGRIIEHAGSEYMIRGRGYAHSLEDLEDIVLSGPERTSPVRVKDVGQVTLGPEVRRGAADLDGKGEAVSGIVILRPGANTADTIRRVKQKIENLKNALPQGVRVVPIYDRSGLIEQSIANMRATLIEVVLTVIIVIWIFLWDIPSSLIPAITIPSAVLIACLSLHALGLTANIMSLGGIAIAAGALVDAGIVVVEQTHKRLEEWKLSGSKTDCKAVVLAATKEVAGPSFYALLVIGVAFLPVLTLGGPEGRLFRPLAYTKTVCMVVGALLAITIDPVLRVLMTRVKRFSVPAPEDRHVLIRLLKRLYLPTVSWALAHRRIVLAAAVSALIATIPIYRSLGSELMPPLDEGTLLYMPSTTPSISIAEARHLLQVTDNIIRSFPEVDHVLGKAGRADTATDPAPLSMLETIITLKPRAEWRSHHTWYSGWAPRWALPLFRRITSDRISPEQLVDDLNSALRIPGVSNAWTMPIRGRIDMLSSGIRTAVGLKITGPDTQTIDRVAADAASLLSSVPGTRSVFPERLGGGRYIDVRWNRAALANSGLSLEDAQAAVQNAIGGEDVSVAFEGRARYPINVRYFRDFRSDIGAINQILVSPAGGQLSLPLSELADVAVTPGASMLRDEDGLLTGYVYVDLDGSDPATYVRTAQETLASRLHLPPGSSVSWSGQYEGMKRAWERLEVVIPLTILLVFLLLYCNTGSLVQTGIILLAAPFSAIGAFGFLYLMHYNLSAATWIGILALLGIDAETGMFMLLYLHQAYEHACRNGRMRDRSDLRQAILEGAVQRIRPKLMTAATLLIGLVPILWSEGPGVDIMKRIAAPMIGGIITSFLLELMVYPVLFDIWKSKNSLASGPNEVGRPQRQLSLC